MKKSTMNHNFYLSSMISMKVSSLVVALNKCPEEMLLVLSEWSKSSLLLIGLPVVDTFTHGNAILLKPLWRGVRM
jgi:hypothetical protein